MNPTRRCLSVPPSVAPLGSRHTFVCSDSKTQASVPAAIRSVESRAARHKHLVFEFKREDEAD